jgi:zinc transport system permease protein
MNELAAFFSYAFIQRALIAGILVAVAAALLGVFVVLRRMSFFSDAIAHASLAGVAIGLLLQLHPTVGAIAVSLVIAMSMAGLLQRRTLSADTIIGVLFSTSLALAVFIISSLPSARADLNSLLFGDILAVTRTDILLALALLTATVVFMYLFTRSMVVMTFNRELAEVERGKTIKRVDYAFLGLLALTIAISLKMIGAILVSALIIIPAATAQNISRNLRQMFIFSIIFALLSVIFGLLLSFTFNSPSGSTIVLTSGAFFILSLALRSDS